MIKKLIFFFFFFLTQTVVAAPLSTTEDQINRYIINNKKNQISLLKKLVNINSGTTNIAGVYRVGEIVRKQFNQLGFKTHWVKEPASMHRAGTLIAKRKGHNGKHVLLIGHLDTVFAPDSQFNRFEIVKNKAKGPGALDAKGGVVVILYALKALQAAHALKDTSITVVLTGDEEDSGKPSSISRKPLIEAAKNVDVALDFEPTITLATSSISRRGISDWIIEAHGNESHSATIFQKEVGDGAIFELSRIVNAMHDQLKGEKYLTFNPGIILGGTTISYDKKASKGKVFGKPNVVAKIALARGDFRYVDVNQRELIKTKMADIVKQHLPGTSATITFQDGIPAMPPTDNNLTLLQKYSEASVDLGTGSIKPLEPGVRGAGDISYIASIVPANLAGLGPMGIGAHSVKETIELDTLPVQTQRTAILLYRLTRQ